MGGACCAGTRDKINYGKDRGSEMCGIVQQNMKTRMVNARMGIQSAKKKVKEKFNVAKLKARGYTQLYCDVLDESEFEFLTKFEQENFQMCKVTLDSFEKALKEFVEKEETKFISKDQIVESFKTRKYLLEVENEYSLSYGMLTHPIFQKEPDLIYIPYLQLVAILYSASTFKMKAVSFYQMVKVENTNRIPKDDPFLVEYLRKLLEISYIMALSLYNEFNEDEQNHKDTREFDFMVEDQDLIFKHIYSEFIEGLFGRDLKLAEEVFVHRFEREEQKNYLQPWELRKIINKHRLDIEAQKRDKINANQ